MRRSIYIVSILIAVFALGCERKEKVQAGIEDWWGSLSEQEQARITRPAVNLSERDAESYKLQPVEGLSAKEHAQASRFCEWWNSLTPEQIEGYARKRQAEKIAQWRADSEDEREHIEEVARQFQLATQTIRPVMVGKKR